MHATGVHVGPGDVVNFRSNGGGGYGDPRKRDPELVLQDMMNEMISEEVARKIYGVVIKWGIRRRWSSKSTGRRPERFEKTGQEKNFRWATARRKSTPPDGS